MVSFRDTFSRSKENRGRKRRQHDRLCELGIVSGWCVFCKHAEKVVDFEHGNRTMHSHCGKTGECVDYGEGMACFEPREEG